MASLPPTVLRLLQRFYPHPSQSGTLAFYSWVRQHTGRHSQLLNLGAGPAAVEPVRNFRGEVAEVVGVDPDPVVLTNHQLDRAYVTAVDQPLPFENCAFDIVLSDFVLEHLENPRFFLSQAARVLKPGGRFFFRTPNKHHYAYLAARMTGPRLHKMLANRLRCLPPEEHEPWPTFYRLNDRREITRAAAAAGFSSVELRLFEAEPSYLVFHPMPFLLGVAYERTVNRFSALANWRANIFGQLRK